MAALYLTPASISFLTQLILSAAIAAYLGARARRAPDAEGTVLTAFFAALTVLLALFFLESASLPARRLTFVYLESTVLAVAIALLMRFAYRVEGTGVRHPRELRAALGAALAYAAWEAAFAAYRFVRVGHGEVLYRSKVMDYALLALLVWVPLVLHRAFLVRAGAEAGAGPGRWRRILSLRETRTRALGQLVLVCLLLTVLCVVQLLRSHELLPASLVSMGISLGVLLALFAFSNAYTSYAAASFSFVAKLAGATLTLILALLGVVGWAVGPVHARAYVPSLPDDRTLRFAPNERGGFDVTEAPFRFETALGERLPLYDEPANRRAAFAGECSEPPGFSFPFFGRTYEHVFVCSDGTVGLGQPLTYRSYQYRTVAAPPHILALLVDLYPDDSPGGVFLSSRGDSLVVTWSRLRGAYRRDAEVTVQLTLFRSGAFEVTYRGLLTTGRPFLDYRPDDEPLANLWAIGAVPAVQRGEPKPRLVSFARLPLRTGPEGVVQDFALEFREHQQRLLGPLAWLILGASLAVVVGVPLTLRSRIGRPLEDLLAAVRKADERQLDVHAPVFFRDEIGTLAQSFNALVDWLRSLIATLEERVARRTAELTEANAELRAKLDEIGALQEQLREAAIRDPLTGLYNRRYLEETMEREIGLARRNGWPVGIVMLDVDNFKLVNDGLGHATGDRVLDLVARTLVSGVRRTDIVCRHGGDEFLLILPNASDSDGRRQVDAIRSRFDAEIRLLLGDFVPRVSLSAGVVAFPGHGDEIAELLEAVDRSMYEAKRELRSRAGAAPAAP